MSLNIYIIYIILQLKEDNLDIINFMKIDNKSNNEKHKK